MNRLKKKYIQEVIPAIKKKFGYKNNLAVPRLGKAIVNIGINQAQKDPAFIGNAESILLRIVGQKPVKTLAKKSIAGFKIRQGMVVGIMVTVRGLRMYDFVDKLINIALPRIKDFRGLSPRSLDRQGNLSIGFKEHICFPEIGSDEIERLHGLEVAIHTTAKNKEEGLVLLKLLGFPFKDKD